MFTFLLLCIVVFGILVCAVAATVLFGGTFLVVFGDVCVCVLIIMGLAKVCKALFGTKDDI